jgi:DNA topoisomerase-1
MAKGEKNLVVVESPAKAKTIGKYLGKNFVVKASVGHIKDLNKHTLSVDIKNGFIPKYEIIKGKKEIIKELKAAAKQCDTVYLATDPDREGEAIAWHIAEEIRNDNQNIKRILFNEITEKGIKQGMANPRDLDENLFNSQQARRVLDRLIGYKISPFLSNTLVKKTSKALSAGRVQSVALRLICEREEDIENFVPFTYWNIIGKFLAHDKVISAKLIKFDGKQIVNPEGSQKPQRNESEKEYKKRISKFLYIASEEEAKELIERIKKGQFRVKDLRKKKITEKPKPPFITSTLQQAAARKLGFSNKQTMQLAQKLYEGVPLGNEGNVGLITYMRTDSVRVSQDAIDSVREFIRKTFGEKYLPEKPNIYQSKSANVQDAHEAIRPTYISRTPESVKPYLDKNLYALYELIYNRFVASQMPPAEFEQTTIDISDGNFVFRATGRILLFDGFLAIYKDEEKENEKDSDEEKVILPNVKIGEELKLSKVEAKMSQTQPPARYNQASLIKELEEKGIGRPSTYATIVSTLLERNYVTLKNKAFYPTELGKEVNQTLLKFFSEIFNVEYTAKMEEELDTIAEGKTKYIEVLTKFYEPLENLLKEAQKEAANGVVCEVCGAPMVVRVGKFGRFLGCSNYPKCKNVKPLYEVSKEEPEIAEGVFCDLCGAPMVIREGRYGKFYSCSNYPDCKGTKPIENRAKSKKFTPIPVPDEKCPKCGSEMVLRTGKNGYFLACSKYPNCRSTKKVTKDEVEKLLHSHATEAETDN